MGRFLLGFIVGAAVSATAVILATPRSGVELRQGVTDALDAALAEGRAAAAAREQELWNEFRQRLEASQQQLQPPPSDYSYTPPPLEY